MEKVWGLLLCNGIAILVRTYVAFFLIWHRPISTCYEHIDGLEVRQGVQCKGEADAKT